jgi:hypothetical protein
MKVSKLVPVYRYGEAESFIKIPFEVFDTLQHGDTLSVPGDNGVGIKAYEVLSKEAYIYGDDEPIYALQVEEW